MLAHSLGSAFALACGPALHDRLAVIVIASGMGPLRPGEPFHPGSRADNVYWRLARRQASWRTTSASDAAIPSRSSAQAIVSG